MLLGLVTAYGDGSASVIRKLYGFFLRTILNSIVFNSRDRAGLWTNFEGLHARSADRWSDGRHLSSDQASLYRISNDVDPRGQGELLHHACPVRLDGSLTDKEFRRNVAVRVALGHELEDLSFPGR